MIWDNVVIQIGVVVVTLATIAFVWYLEGRGRWRAHLEERFIYGIPWGSVVTVVGVVVFYLFAQSGLTHWDDPVIHAFRSWAYNYPLGILTSGFAHAGPGHLLGNMMGTVVFAPIVEYFLGHYPPSDETDESGETERGREHQTGRTTQERREPSQSERGQGRRLKAAGRNEQARQSNRDQNVPDDDWTAGYQNQHVQETEQATRRRDQQTPAHERGQGQERHHWAPEYQGEPGPDKPGPDDPGLGGAPPEDEPEGLLDTPWFRALVVFPVAMIVVSLLTSVFALGWSLGFSGTVFALMGIALIRYPITTLVGMAGFSAVNVVVSAIQNPVLVATSDPGGPSPPSWAGVNVQAHLLGFLLGVLIAVALLAARNKRPDVERVAIATVLVVLTRGLWAFALGSDGTYRLFRGIGVIFILVISALIIGLVATSERSRTKGLRFVFGAGVVLVIIVIVLPTVAFNAPGMNDDPVPENNGFEIRDYTVTYAENATHGRIGSNESGVIVVSEQRQLWSAAVDKNQLAHSGEATVVVGGLGWRETVEANRTGWNVAGNDSAYVVDLSYDGERVRSFTSDPVEAQSQVANQTIRVVPTAETFLLRVHRDGQSVGDVEIPALNETATVGELQFSTELNDDTKAVFAEQDGTRVLIAEVETFD